jgi:hypothetical protein
MGPTPQSPIPNPQSPIPNPQLYLGTLLNENKYSFKINLYFIILNKKIYGRAR